MGLKRWTKEEDQLLISNYNDTSTEKLALIVGRSRKAVERRAHKLGVATKTPKISIDLVRSEFDSVGYTVLDNLYVNSRTKINFMCSNGHKAELTWNKFKGGRRCPRCYYDPGDMYNRVLQSFKYAGYKLLLDREEYVSSKQKLPFVCPNGHRHEIDWNCFGRGQRCVKCAPNISGAEKEICSFVKSLGFDVLENNRDLLGGVEVDIYVPCKRVAIEYCGLRWHGENFSGRHRNYHYLKYKKCLENGVRLITIFEDEYLERPGVVLSRIRAALGAISNTIFARTTTFKSISTEQAKEFLNQNHLQGYSPCKYKYGLFFEDRLVQVITFGCVSRKHADSGNMLELKRLAAIPDSIIVGGAQKLFKNAVKLFEGYSSVKSYCDLRWANPFTTVYDLLGFTLTGSTKYTPHYVKKQKRYRNYTLRKSPEERLTGKTEWELRREQGYDRIWDCGHKTYTYYINGGG